jgi:hypothetical protein
MNHEIMTAEFLLNNPNVIFVYGDNTIRAGTGGAAKHRYIENTHGFITKKLPQNSPEAFFKPDEYEEVYLLEIAKLKAAMLSNPTKKYYVSQVGAGLANRYGIWEQVIKPTMKSLLSDFEHQITWMWEKEGDVYV